LRPGIASRARRASRIAALLLVALALALVLLGVACGGKDKPSEEFLSRSDEVIRRFVPDASGFNLLVFSTSSGAVTDVDFKVMSLLEGEPRMHVVSDNDAIVGGELVDEYEGFDIYLTKDTYWAELKGSAPLVYAGAKDLDGVKAYIDFYVEDEATLEDERFWEAFDYAEQRISEILEDSPSLLTVDFEGLWREDVSGLRVEAMAGERHVYFGVLYDSALPRGETFDGETIAAFEERFAVAPEAEEEPENEDWDFAHKVWFLDEASAAGGE
jgi:hypothetical protein